MLIRELSLSSLRILSRTTEVSSFEVSYVNQRVHVVDKLEDEILNDQATLIFLRSSMILEVGHIVRQRLVD